MFGRRNKPEQPGYVSIKYTTIDHEMVDMYKQVDGLLKEMIMLYLVRDYVERTGSRELYDFMGYGHHCKTATDDLILQVTNYLLKQREMILQEIRSPGSVFRDPDEMAHREKAEYDIVSSAPIGVPTYANGRTYTVTDRSLEYRL